MPKKKESKALAALGAICLCIGFPILFINFTNAKSVPPDKAFFVTITSIIATVFLLAGIIIMNVYFYKVRQINQQNEQRLRELIKRSRKHNEAEDAE